MTIATYRFQLNTDFRFEHLQAQVEYLRKLGISTIYTSPILQARAGSTHGYDVVDPTKLNPELGTNDQFDQLVEAARQEGLDLLVDIVPNHMAASTQNPWWTDVLRQGQDSPFASYFDVDWSSADVREDLADKVLLPILGRPYGDVLEDQELRIVYEAGAFRIQYYERRLPLNFASYVRILEAIRDRLTRTGKSGTIEELAPILQTLATWEDDDTDFPDVEEIRALQRRTERATRSRFLAEGLRVVEDLLASDLRVVLVVASSSLQDSPRGGTVLTEAARAGV
ncbi:MAG: hypothetical protein KY432_04655, partial [Acidobacteria bacterium]|nr:hypothetical protein [Acidobacteriota bacterium]